MTIAVCYVSPEGVVFGSDTAGTVLVAVEGEPPTERYFNHQQKIFPVGDPATLAAIVYGMANLGDRSMRSLFALYARELQQRPAFSMNEVAERFLRFFEPHYLAALTAEKHRIDELQKNPSRSVDEDAELLQTEEATTVGFMLGGYVDLELQPVAFDLLFRLTTPCVAKEMRIGCLEVRGTDRLLARVQDAIDPHLLLDIFRSGKWQGSREELESLAKAHHIQHPQVLPLREAVDWVHSVVSFTIKTIKFSRYPPCAVVLPTSLRFLLMECFNG